MQLFEVSDEPAALDGEDEAVRGVVMPSRDGVGALERIMRAVDLDRVDLPAGVRQLGGMAQPARIKGPAPAGIVPAGNADADGARTAHPQVSPLRSSGGRGRDPTRRVGRVRWAASPIGSSASLTLPSP